MTCYRLLSKLRISTEERDVAIEVELSSRDSSEIKQVIRFNRERFELLKDDAKAVFLLEFVKEFREDMKTYRLT